MNPQGIEVTYESQARNHIIVNERPKKIMLDNSHYETAVQQGSRGYTITLPSGSHTAKIIVRSTGAISLRSFSMISSVTIVLVSGMAGVILLGLYVTGTLRKRRRNNHGSKD